ncbi:MAG TPA: hypothetical protein PK634_10070 [Kiritimatiellia bacterium]|nr:hypothetical protein [Kiritimatiellia bacterium]
MDALAEVVLNGRHEAVEGLIRSAMEHGGAPVTAPLAADLGAGYAKDAAHAVQKLGDMLSRAGKEGNRR